MSAPVIWILLPLAAAAVMSFIRNQRLLSILGGSFAVALAAFAQFVPIEEAMRILQERVGLPVLPDTTIPGMVTRLDVQKGVDIALRRLRMLGKQNWQLVLLGAGDPKLETMAKSLQAEMPDRIRVEPRYDAKLARQIYAGADVFLMPSRYEPCGISQMISMRYGCLPLVRAVGGLHDTVTDGETGFAFVEAKVKPFNDAIRRAINLYPDRERWVEMQKAGMALDFSWPQSARKYLELYKKLMVTPGGGGGGAISAWQATWH